MTNVKEGQIYICTKSDRPWWTVGKEYKVVLNSYGDLCFVDDDGGDKWYIPNDNLLNNWFKLKEKAFDLNELTTEQLREYIGLLEDKEESERLLHDFIERIRQITWLQILNGLQVKKIITTEHTI